MRRLLVTVALGAGLAATALPVAPASAYCDAVWYALTGRCTNGCAITGQAYQRADAAAGDALPDVPFECPA